MMRASGLPTNHVPASSWNKTLKPMVTLAEAMRRVAGISMTAEMPMTQRRAHHGVDTGQTSSAITPRANAPARMTRNHQSGTSRYYEGLQSDKQGAWNWVGRLTLAMSRVKGSL